MKTIYDNTRPRWSDSLEITEAKRLQELNTPNTACVPGYVNRSTTDNEWDDTKEMTAQKVLQKMHAADPPCSSAAIDLTTSLLAHWSLEEGTGVRADALGTYTLTNSGAVLGVPGKVGDAAQFVQANTEYLSTNSAGLRLNGVSWTITGWVYFNTVATVQGIIGKYEVGSLEYMIYLMSSASGITATITNDGMTVEGNTNGTPILAGQWYFFAVWFDVATNNLYVSVNGGGFSMLNCSGPVYSGSSEFCIGTISSAIGFSDAIIDEVSIWKGRVLTASERNHLWNGGAGRAYPW